MPADPPNAIHPPTLAAWRAWLEANHAQSSGVWLISYNQASGRPRFDFAEAVEEALCFGWIDSKGKKVDAERSMVWISPRKSGSGWSQVNKARIERLSAEGRLTAAGLAKIAAAQADGSWTLLDQVETLEAPPDLQAALAANPAGQAHYAAFPRSAKRAILVWITQAKRPETRAKRIATAVAEAAENRRAAQPTAARPAKPSP